MPERKPHPLQLVCSERNAEIRRLYEARELSLQAIGDRYGISRERVRQLTHRPGTPSRPRLAPRVHITADQVIAVLPEHRTLRAVALHFRCGLSTLTTCLIREGRLAEIRALVKTWRQRTVEERMAERRAEFVALLQRHFQPGDRPTADQFYDRVGLPWQAWHAAFGYASWRHMVESAGFVSNSRGQPGHVSTVLRRRKVYGSDEPSCDLWPAPV